MSKPKYDSKLAVYGEKKDDSIAPGKSKNNQLVPLVQQDGELKGQRPEAGERESKA